MKIFEKLEVKNAKKRKFFSLGVRKLEDLETFNRLRFTQIGSKVRFGLVKAKDRLSKKCTRDVCYRTRNRFPQNSSLPARLLGLLNDLLKLFLLEL